jgi:glutamate-5-semialdehyde dehydrogenase
MSLSSDFERSLQILRKKSREMRRLASEKKNQALLDLASRLEAETADVLTANQVDLQNLSADTTVAFRDRLTLNPQRIAGMVESLRQVAKLPDPVGEVVEEKTLPNGLKLRRVRAPLGVILMIFESRPNVILEAFSLAFKSGNSIVLRGGSDSKNTAQFFYRLMKDVLSKQGLQDTAFLGVEDYDRSLVEMLLKRKDLIDIVVPRGGEKLIDFVQRTALMPIIKNDRGLCHAYVDDEADLQMAVKIVDNAKTQRPGVCNSLETVLVHKAVAERFLPLLYQATEKVGLQWRVDAASEAILKGKSRIQRATEEDWNTEHLDQILNCRVVESFEQAFEHIDRYGSKHSETIITANEGKARQFQEDIDAAAVYWNASTRFTDGFEFGLGGELGISTQKLHVRGPVGLRELTTPRWIIDGHGQIR